ncbi:hypothetical protein IQ260_23875 [Leptolyngbya cf. ectocarpi LEGE 11479]|uniref:Uncharacterized protein n=1 Tax=Leptolyngbya cf. ectocarpi LEGE 11479 TaxID=1828722 RepID=A0A928ZY96_LEPEC|nr:hypothetical protein [Leptolyngbya ectocarpi]MBE9069689.1 hypothetical protein [Leptolyngbya cf. ectocarpi LEGE 11479]
MLNVSCRSNPLVSLLVGSLLVVGGASAATAQIDVTGGEVILENAEIFVPDVARPDLAGPSLIYDRTIQDGSLQIRTTQGDLPVTLIYRDSVIPTLSTEPGAEPAVDDSGRLQGTVSFRGFNALGEPAVFANIPTTLEFDVTAIGNLTATDFNEYRTGLFQLAEVGTVTSPSSLGVVARGTPVLLVQYGPRDGMPTDQVVLGNEIPAELYTETTEGINYSTANLDLTFTGGEVLVPNPPGFSPDGSTGTEVGSGDTGTAIAIFISGFNDFVIIDRDINDRDINEDDAGNEDDNDVGMNQDDPVLPVIIITGVFVFENVPSGVWYDPPMADGFEYVMQPRDIPIGVASRVFPGLSGRRAADDAKFAAISGFPRGIDDDDRFTVSVDGVVLGEFGPNDTLTFGDYGDVLGDKLEDGGVSSFLVTGLDPAVDSDDPTAFPLKLDFTTPTASFEMRARQTAAVVQGDLSDALADASNHNP